MQFLEKLWMGLSLLSDIVWHCLAVSLFCRYPLQNPCFYTMRFPITVLFVLRMKVSLPACLIWTVHLQSKFTMMELPHCLVASSV